MPAAQPDAGAGVLEITVGGLRNRDGQVLVAVFTAADGFPGEAEQAYRKARSPLAGQSATFRFEEVPYGTYAVSVVHDENANGRLDKNFLGIPTEGAGVSNNPKPGFGPPRFETATFAVKDHCCAVEVNVLYP